MDRSNTLLRRAFVLRTNDLGQRVVRGAGFQFLGIALRTLTTIVSTAILARLLTPADFGYVAMATVITEFAALFSNFGFNNLLIQRRVINRLQVDTVFWASLGLGALLAAAVFLASFFAGWWFADPRVGELLRVLAFAFVLGGLTTVPGVVLARLLRFRMEFWISIATVMVRTLVAIGCAHAGLGMWSLVAGALAGGVVEVVLGFAAVPYAPRLRFQLAYLARTWRTSGSYFGGGLLFYVNMNVDLLLIGRGLGATSLGYYQSARGLTDEIRARIAMPLQRVLFPAFSAVQNERERLQQMLLRSARLIAALVFPLGVGIAATAQELVPTLYGPQWLQMVPVMSMFGLSAALKASTAIATPLFNAHDRVGLAMRYNAISTVGLAAAVWLALPHGIQAVALAVVIVSLYTLVPFRVALGLAGLHSRHVVEILGAPLMASLAMWLAVTLVRTVSSSWFATSAGRLAFHVLIGTLVYVVCLHLQSRRFLADLRMLVQKVSATA